MSLLAILARLNLYIYNLLGNDHLSAVRLIAMGCTTFEEVAMDHHIDRIIWEGA